MSLDIRRERGTPLERQALDWKDLVRVPYSKLDDEAFTRVRVLLLTAVEAEAVRFQHAAARMDRDLQGELARVRRIEHFQHTQLVCLTPPDQSALETALGVEQLLLEVTAELARREPDPGLAKVQRFGLLEHLDHLFRYAALHDRLEGQDANDILQSETDITPGRPTPAQHRHPLDDLRHPYDRRTAAPASRLHAYTLLSMEHLSLDSSVALGPQLADPVARQLCAELAAVEEQHVTQAESVIDADETWLEKWLLHEGMEVWCAHSCAVSESNPRLRALWERRVEEELGHLHFVADLFQRHENRDAFEVLPETLPAPLRIEEHRSYLRKVLQEEHDLRPHGEDLRSLSQSGDSARSVAVRERLNQQGSPSDAVAAGYRWRPGTELLTSAQSARAAMEGRLQ